MKPACEGDGGVRRHVPLNDEAAEKLLAGHRLTDLGDLADLAPVLDGIRSLRDSAVPPPSPALTRILDAGAPDGVRPLDGSGGTGNRIRRGRRVATKAPWAAVAAALVLAVAATLDVLPGPAQRMVATAVSAVTPFELPGDTGRQTTLPKEPGSDAAGVRRSPKPPSDAARSGQPEPPARTGPVPTGLVPPTPATPQRSGSTIPARPGVPPTAAPAPSSAVRSSPRTSLPMATVPVTTPPVVTNPPPPGESSGGVAPRDRRSATLTGASVLPGPGDPDGAGTASVELNPEKAELCLTLTLSAVAQPTGIHLHQALQGQTGPVVVELPPPAEGSPPAPVCVPVSSDLSKKLRDEPAGYYLEVHTREFPDGALRGQLST